MTADEFVKKCIEEAKKEGLSILVMSVGTQEEQANPKKQLRVFAGGTNCARCMINILVQWADERRLKCDDEEELPTQVM